MDCRTVPNALRRPEKVLSASYRIRLFTFDKAFSTGLKSGLFGGKYRYLIPARFGACWNAAVLCAKRLSKIRTGGHQV